MNVKTLGIYGYSYSDLQKYKKTYRIIRVSIYLFDIVLMALITSILFSSGAKFSSYIWFLSAMVIIVSLILGVALDDKKYSVALDAKRIQDSVASCEVFHLDEEDIKSILSKRKTITDGSFSRSECVILRLHKLFKNNKKHSRSVLSELRTIKKDEGKFTILTYIVKDKHGDKIILIGTLR